MTPAASVSVAEHLALVLAGVRALPAARIALGDALGCVLGEAVTALVDSPGFDNSAMDGYAVRASDIAAATPQAPVALEVIADLPAGASLAPRLAAGQAARIMTGAPVPDGADAVVPYEQTDAGMDRVGILAPVDAGAHIRRRGSDAVAGSMLLAPGQVITARHLGAAAAVGLRDIVAIPRPRVGVVATGSELAAPGAALRRGQVHDSNSALIAAAVTEAGGVPVVLGRSVDRPEQLVDLLQQSVGIVDAVVVTGGIGHGAYDVVRLALDGDDSVAFAQVRMQPGRPQALGQWPTGTPLFGLPGNPVATYVSFLAFVEPSLRVMRGLPAAGAAPLLVPAGAQWRSRPDREQRVPVRLVSRGGGGLEACPTAPGARTHQPSALALADGLAVIGEGVELVAVGDLIPVIPLPGWVA